MSQRNIMLTPYLPVRRSPVSMGGPSVLPLIDEDFPFYLLRLLLPNVYSFRLHGSRDNDNILEKKKVHFCYFYSPTSIKPEVISVQILPWDGDPFSYFGVI